MLRAGRGLLGATGIYVIGNILNAAIPFFLLPVLTRVLSPEEYGTVAMFTLVIGIMGAFTGLSVHGAISVRYFQLNERAIARYVGTCLAILAVSTVFILATAALTRPWLEAFTHVPGDWLMIAVLVSAAQFVVNIRLSLWQVKRQPIAYGLFQVSQSVLNASLSLLLVLGTTMAWQGRALGQALAAGGFMLIGLLLLWRNGEVSSPTSKDDARDALRFGVPLIPHALGGLMIVTVDRFMISNMLDVDRTGIYMVALQFGMVLGLIADSFNRAYAPWLMGALVNEDPVRDHKIVRGTYLYFAIASVAALAMAGMAPFVLTILAGEQFQQAADVVPYIAFGYAFCGMYYMVTNYIFFSGKTAYLAMNTFITGLFNVLATYFLIKMNGLVGAAQAFMLSQAFLFLGTWWIACRVRPMPWRAAIFPVPHRRAGRIV
ncbi:lipopolysaccharide biosynthesis protein [Nitrococcus mobilis]|nr:oligosaccharide flippase family protein [Nitrococcus mobilis]